MRRKWIEQVIVKNEMRNSGERGRSSYKGQCGGGVKGSPSLTSEMGEIGVEKPQVALGRRETSQDVRRSREEAQLRK